MRDDFTVVYLQIGSKQSAAQACSSFVIEYHCSQSSNYIHPLPLVYYTLFER